MKNTSVKNVCKLLLCALIGGCSLGDRNEKLVKLNCGIYLKEISWGFDKQRTYISKSPDFRDTINEPYFKALDFFYKVENCNLIIIKADSLNRSQLLDTSINIFNSWTEKIDFSNYDSLGFENIMYK